MRKQVFGRTGLPLSIVGMGSNRLGDPEVDPKQWPPIVRRALELGITFFDTSGSYNQGRSEAILGEVTAGWKDRVYISTKVGFPVETNDAAKRSYSSEFILAEVEDSLRRLRLEAIDMYMLHSPTVEHLEQFDWPEAITKLRSQGKIRFFGISTQDHASGIWALRHGVDLLQIEYNLLDPTAEDELLPLAQEQNAGVMVRMPLARGLLTGKFPVGQAIPADQQWRRPKGDQLQLRLRRIEQLRFLERDGQTLGQAAIRFAFAHPAVHCAIPGARTIAQLEQNTSAANGDLSAEELERIHMLHDTWRAEGRW